MILALFIYTTFSKKDEGVSFKDLNTFSFLTSQGKQFTLHNSDQSINQKAASFSFLNKYKKDDDAKRWYYIHIDSKNILKAQKVVHIDAGSQIIKDTYILYLTPIQLQKLMPYSLYLEISPSDKIEGSDRFHETDLLFVKTSSNYDLQSNSDLYTIERRNSEDSYIIRVNQNDLTSSKFTQRKHDVAKLLSEIPSVRSVSAYKNPVKQNNINIGWLQKNNQPLHRDATHGLYKYDRYLHDHGLTGEGQIITIEDTPIDFRHPFFRDDQVTVDFNKDMENHRKFLYYYSDTDMAGWEKAIKDDDHGSHTAGTLAGKNIVKDSVGSMYDGSAPDAKLVYVGMYGNVTAKELEERMNSHNSRISSNSWGDTDIHVDSLNHEYGSLAYRNPQSIFIFSAGNSALFGNFTVGDPGGNKNLLSCGYSSNPVFTTKQQYTLQSIEHPSMMTFVYGELIEFDILIRSDFLGSEKGDSKIIAIDTKDIPEENVTELLCDEIIGPHLSVLYGKQMEDIYSLLNMCKINETLGIVISENETAIKELQDSHDKVEVIYNNIVDEPYTFAKGMYSSMGPGSKGIMKPDLIAPGSYVVSAKSIQTGNESYTCSDVALGCGLSIKSGTSMAAPNVAGSIALVSQYFSTGRWISGQNVLLDGPTMRALVINSCVHPFGSLSPDFYYGHGFVDMSTLLPLEGGFGLQITEQNEKRPSVTNNGHVVAKIEVKSNKVPLQITLSYLDIVLDEKSPLPLTRDLDLVVVSPDGKVYIGDNVKNDTQHFSTNEKVVINQSEVVVGTYTVHVYGYSFLDSSLTRENEKQEFAVAATGDIENKFITFSESSEIPPSCKKADKNHPGLCECNDDEIGPFCQAKIYDFDADNGMINVTIDSLSIFRMRIKSKLKITSVSAYYNNYRALPTMWISDSCHMSLGEYDMNGKIGPRKPNVTEITLGKKEICVAVFSYCDFRTDYHFEFSGVKDDDGGKDNDSNSKLNKILIALIVVFSIILVVLVIVIIILVVKLKKEKQNFTKITSSDKPEIKENLM